MFGLQPLQPLELLRADQGRLGVFRQVQEVSRVALSHLLAFVVPRRSEFA